MNWGILAYVLACVLIAWRIVDVLMLEKERKKKD